MLYCCLCQALSRVCGIAYSRLGVTKKSSKLNRERRSTTFPAHARAYEPEPLAVTGAAGPLGSAVPMPGVLLLPMDVEFLCFIVLWCVIPVVPEPADWFVVWALSPACKPVFELGGLFWAKAVLETQSTAPIAHAIEKCFMPVFLSVRRARRPGIV